MTRRAPTARAAVLFATLLIATAACVEHHIVCTIGPPPPKPLVLGERMPDDFDFALWTYDDSKPRTALDIDVRADGSGSWRVWVPATKAEASRGELHVDASHVAAVWAAVVDSKLDRIDAGTPSPDVCSGGASGIQRFAIWAGEGSRYVWRPPGTADLDPLRRAVLDLVRSEVAAKFTGASSR